MTVLNLLENHYKIIDTKEKITVPDCFVVAKNKIGTAHGEAKLYIGNENQDTREFFGSKGFINNCIILKKDLVKYMEDAKSEYLDPEQQYCAKNEFPELWNERLEKVNLLDDVIHFQLHEQTQIAGPRIYVNSEDYIYKKIIRELSLPNITYLAAIKLENPDSSLFYYYRLFVDYFGENENTKEVEKEVKKIESSNIEKEEKIQLTRARIGQGKYRQGLLELCPFCPITMVADDRLLIASHIKPWAVSNEQEKVDPKNGFMFTPTIDFLFDRGFISFTNDRRMKVSPWLSKMTCSKLNIVPDKKYDFLPVEGREIYLDYHRNNIFKG